jgi:hypothetical protein
MGVWSTRQRSVSGFGRWRVSWMSASVGCGRRLRRGRWGGVGSRRRRGRRGSLRTRSGRGSGSLRVVRVRGRGGSAAEAVVASGRSTPILVCSRIWSGWWMAVRVVIRSCRCGGRQRACASSQPGWLGSGIRSAIARWRGCCARPATACRPIARRTRAQIIPIVTLSSSTSTRPRRRRLRPVSR